MTTKRMRPCSSTYDARSGHARLGAGVGGDPEAEGGGQEAGEGPGVAHPELDGVPAEQHGDGPGRSEGRRARVGGDGHAGGLLGKAGVGVVVEGGEERVRASTRWDMERAANSTGW